MSFEALPILSPSKIRPKSRGRVILKFGGTSLKDRHAFAQAAQHCLDWHRQGYALLVVVSAMAGETERLLALTRQWVQQPQGRELDQLLSTGEQVSAALMAMVLHEQGLCAQSLNGAQMGLLTQGPFTKARISQLSQDRIEQLWQQGYVVVATGFQGVDEQGNMTTLGRGGSDTSAVALAAMLQAEHCVIYTDVAGVYTADPRICPQARLLSHVTYGEMLEMASLGAKVLQIRSVELAMNYRVPLQVRSTFQTGSGTSIDAMETTIEQLQITGIAHSINEARLTLRALPENPMLVAQLFQALAAAQINVDVIVQSSPGRDHLEISFSVASPDATGAFDVCEQFSKDYPGCQLDLDPKVGKLSVIGVGMMSHPGVAATMFTALAQAQIPILIISTSEIKITCLVPKECVHQGVGLLHDAFGLTRPTP